MNLHIIKKVLKPQDVDIQNSLAICYWYMGDKQKSLEILDEVIQENQENPDVLANVTNLMFDLGEDEKVSIDQANQSAVERMTAARPMLTAVDVARDVIPDLGERMLLHAGPPIAWERMSGPLKGASALARPARAR